MITILRGNPTPEELAAVLTVLAACSAVSRDSGPAMTTATDQQERPAASAGASGWLDRSAGLRAPLRIGPDSWRRSAWR